jgi:hypothetical protein
MLYIYNLAEKVDADFLNKKSEMMNISKFIQQLVLPEVKILTNYKAPFSFKV